ncbi:MAG: NAD(P)/FAD-dependent oxidoreductase [Candidatus Hadarchaeales archaeon]
MRKDLVVVGGGPSGCFLAQRVAQRGFEVLLVEEHPHIGKPVSCAGVVGVKGMKEVGVKAEKFALNKVRRGLVFSPSGEVLELERGRTEALVLDREAFDKHLAELAVEEGVELRLQTRCVEVRNTKRPTTLLTGKGEGEIKTRMLVGADGPTSLVARKSGMMGRRRFIRCVQAEVKTEVEPDTVEVYLGSSSIGLFGWVVPAGEVARIGIGTLKGDPGEGLRSLLKFLSPRLRGEPKKLSFGLIPYDPPRHLVKGSVLLVGDAACQVKPLTGGGIYLGLSCALKASEALFHSLEREDPTFLKLYPKEVKRTFGRELMLGRKLREFMSVLSDEELDALVKCLNEPKLREEILKKADFDHHSSLLEVIFSNLPRLLTSLGPRALTRMALKGMVGLDLRGI